MHRRSPDDIECRIGDWECLRQALGPAASPAAASLIDRELDRLRHELALRDKARVLGRRATDPKPTLLVLFS